MVGKYIIKFLLSLKTTAWLLCLLLILFFVGAFVMPSEESFQFIHSQPLLQWLIEQPARVTWWLWGSVGILGILVFSTIFCSVDSLIKKRGAENLIAIISPQIIHAGFLFLLLAHLATSIGGFKSFGVAGEGTILGMPGNALLRIENINALADSSGYILDWSVNVEYRLDGKTTKDLILPNKPFFRKGIGVYVKDVRVFPGKGILIEVSREPGAVWALIGAILSTTGILALLFFRIRRDRPILPQ